ncbi:universal stress protein [Pseudarthrobacter sp. NIBRBAC000502772]|uniref:universal stress protein n=1 Tax=Pseudarthrobacter sp. NIBRBAC000502772 TaxID=2590775 RepID=UPI001FF07185|nr:universal stress protein [Pseudarthrobacter sp. NIBRBAC000502772]
MIRDPASRCQDQKRQTAGCRIIDRRFSLRRSHRQGPLRSLRFTHTQRTKASESQPPRLEAGATKPDQLVNTHSPASVILDAARDADLIVVGSRGHGGVPGLHLGSVSTRPSTTHNVLSLWSTPWLAS